MLCRRDAKLQVVGQHESPVLFYREAFEITVDFKVGTYEFNSEKQVLQHNGIEQKLTTKESQLLRLLCVHKNDVLDRTFALKSIWHDDNYFNGRSMDVYIAKLRKYLKDDTKVEIINIHGKGFKLLVNQ
ncbi:MAG: winged helix family transcriptional regulator [Sphingobacteriia bacterium]|nr:winged helix family transcriptional regulator [Sphingobacteriia bacterium]